MSEEQVKVDEPQSDQEALAAGLAAIEAEEPATEEAKPQEEEAPQQAAPAEGEAESAPEEPPEEPVSRSWAAIKKAEKRNRKLADELRAEKYQLQKMREEIQSSTSKSTDVLTQLKSDPLGTLQQAGFSFEDLAQRVINDGAPGTQEVQKYAQSANQQLLDKISALEQKIEEQTNQKRVEEYMGNVSNLLGSPDYKLLSTLPNAEREIVNLALGYGQQYGQVLSPKEAADILQREWKEHLSTLSSNEAARQILGLSAEEAEAQQDDPSPEELKKASRKPAQKKTALSNKMAASPGTPVKEIPDNLTEEEELRLAAGLLPSDATLVLTES